MNISFVPAITITMSADDWELYSSRSFDNDRDHAAHRLSQAAGEALSIAWSALSKNFDEAKRLGFPAHTLRRIEEGMTVEAVVRLAHEHWEACAKNLSDYGAMDSEPRHAFENLLQRYLIDSPAQSLAAHHTPADSIPRRVIRPKF